MLKERERERTRTGKQSLQNWQEKLDQVLLNITEQFLKLGEVLYHAKHDKNLSPAEYQELMSYVEKYGLKEADIKASIAGYLHENPDLGTEEDYRIDPKLIFAGAKNSKILCMDKQDQQRLLSNEKFQVVMPNGKVDKPRTWAEMSSPSRNMLIGRSGKISSVADQQSRMSVKKTHSIFSVGSIQDYKDSIIFVAKENPVHLKVSVQELARMLLHEGCWDKLEEAVEDAKQEIGREAV